MPKKAPIKYVFLRSTKIFDPKEMITKSSKKLGILMNNIFYLLSLRIMNTRHKDRVGDQSIDLMQREVKLHKEHFVISQKQGQT